MKKGNGVSVEKIVTIMMLVIGIFFMSGCDSKLEQKNTQLNRKLIKTESFNISIVAKLKKLTEDNKNLKNELEKLRDNNKGLNASLAKGELEFSKKHKVELDIERKKLESEREAFEQKKVLIKKRAYEDAKQTLSAMYLLIIGLMTIVLLIIFILLVKNRKDNKKAIEKIESENGIIAELSKEKDKKIIILEDQIKDLKLGSKNQLLTKIEEYKAKRERKSNSLGGDSHGN